MNTGRTVFGRPELRLLFDEQLSEDLPALLKDVFPESLHVYV